MVFENFNIQDLASLDLQTKFLKKWNRLNEIVIAAFKDSSKDIEKILGFSTPVWGTANVGSHCGLIIHNKKKPDGSTIWVHIGLSTMSEQSVWFPVVTMGSQRIPDVQVALALWPESLEKAKRIYGDVSVKLNATLGDIAGSSIGFEAIEDNKYIFFSLREPLN